MARTFHAGLGHYVRIGEAVQTGGFTDADGKRHVTFTASMHIGRFRPWDRPLAWMLTAYALWKVRP